MSRRVSLPGASELFRLTDGHLAADADHAPTTHSGVTPSDDSTDPPSSSSAASAEEPGDGSAPAVARGSGRVRHDEKITVYVSSDELLALEQTRLTLRARHAMAIDRGRIVREAMSAILADFDARGAESELVRRLSDS